MASPIGKKEFVDALGEKVNKDRKKRGLPPISAPQESDPPARHEKALSHTTGSDLTNLGKPRYHGALQADVAISGGPMGHGMEIFLVGAEEKDGTPLRLAPVVRGATIHIKPGEHITADITVDTVGLEIVARATLGDEADRHRAREILRRLAADLPPLYAESLDDGTVNESEA